MGRKTWDSLPPKFRPLPNRLNVVLTRTPDALATTVPEGVVVESSLVEALDKLQDNDQVESIFVIGGGQIYREALELGRVRKIICTEVVDLPPDTQFDTYFPALDERPPARYQASDALIAFLKNR